MADCDRCGATNLDSARFCSACGGSLPSRVHEGLEVRKTVTILFCDVVGSTSLGEATDPETTRKVMSRYAEAMTEVIEQHGGTVERFRGDEVMAVFGIPVTHEDDALRAVRAATAMQERLGRLNVKLRDTWGVELACRFGVNTGEVVAGDPGLGETFVTGDAVNLAKRLEQAAEAGTILIGTATYPLVKDAVKVGPRERFTAKGKDEAVARFRVDEVDDAASGYARRLDAVLVNRVEELAALRSLVDAAFAERRCRVVTLLGAAGIGKSRLVRELAAAFGDVADVVTGRCLPYGSGITFWPLQQLLVDLGGVERAEAVLAGTADGQVVLERLLAVNGTTDDPVPSTEVFWAVRRLLETVCNRRPLLVAFEDLHWAEPTMLDLVEYLAAFASGPLVLLCIARPELLDARASLSTTTLLEIDQLSEEETGTLVQELGVGDADLRRRITATSEGNPLFAEQLAAMMAEAAPGDAIELPASIHALLAARIDGLDPAERRVLERAAIIGKEFWPRALVALSSRADQPLVTSRLLSLVRRGLVQPSRSEVPGEDAYRFRHSLICDETYTGIPKAVRAELHERFVRWLQAESTVGTGLGENEEILGYHLEQAFRCRVELVPGDPGSRVLASEAGGLLAIAGRRALGREDLPAARVMLERALALLPEGDRRRSAVLTELGSAAMRAGEWDHARALLEQAIAAATASGDRRAELRARVELQWQRSYTEPAEAEGDDRRVAEDVIPELEQLDDHLGLSKAWWLLSESHVIAGRWRERSAALERAIVHARKLADRGQLGVLVPIYAQALYYGPTHVEEAVQRCTELLAEASGAPTFEAGVGTTLAGLRAMEGNFGEARRLYAESIAVYQEFGLRFRRAARAIFGAQIETFAGDLAAAESELRLGFAMLEEMGESGVRSVLAGLLADVLSAQGRDSEADGFVEITRATASETDVMPQVLWRRGLARTTARRGDAATAEELARSAVALAETTDSLDLRAGSLVALGDVLREAGKDVESAASLAEARTVYLQKGNRAALAASGSPGEFVS